MGVRSKKDVKLLHSGNVNQGTLHFGKGSFSKLFASLRVHIIIGKCTQVWVCIYIQVYVKYMYVHYYLCLLGKFSGFRSDIYSEPQSMFKYSITRCAMFYWDMYACIGSIHLIYCIQHVVPILVHINMWQYLCIHNLACLLCIGSIAKHGHCLWSGEMYVLNINFLLVYEFI